MLKQTLKKAMQFVWKNSTLQILNCIRLQSKENTITITATDMEKYWVRKFPYPCQDMDICIEPDKLSQFLDLVDWDVSITESKGKIKIQSWTDKIELKYIPASEYIALPEVKWTTFGVSSSIITDWITQVWFCIAPKSFVPVLQGMNIRTKWGKAYIAGSDSLRLACAKFNCEWDFDIIIPQNNLWAIKSSLLDMWWHIDVTVAWNLVKFSNKDTEITSLLITGNFPDYLNGNIIPKENDNILLPDKQVIANAIKKCLILTKWLNNFVKLYTENDKIMLWTGDNVDIWESSSEIGNADGKVFKTAFNGKFLLDVLPYIQKLEIHFSEEKPILVKDWANSDYIYIIKPISL